MSLSLSHTYLWTKYCSLIKKKVRKKENNWRNTWFWYWINHQGNYRNCWEEKRREQMYRHYTQMFQKKKKKKRVFLKRLLHDPITHANSTITLSTQISLIFDIHQAKLANMNFVFITSLVSPQFALHRLNGACLPFYES